MFPSGLQWPLLSRFSASVGSDMHSRTQPCCEHEHVEPVGAPPPPHPNPVRYRAASGYETCLTAAAFIQNPSVGGHYPSRKRVKRSQPPENCSHSGYSHHVSREHLEQVPELLTSRELSDCLQPVNVRENLSAEC